MNKNKETDMPEKDPASYELITYAWVMIIACWGGVVSFYKRVRTGETDSYKFMELIGEIVTSGFTGLITFYLCEAAGFDQLLTAVCVGICGHMGTRAIYQIEKMVEMKLGISHYPIRKSGDDKDNG
jgi:hypothetical protein